MHVFVCLHSFVRLYIGTDLGQGELIAYSCIGTEHLNIGYPDWMGKQIKFKAGKLFK